MKNFFWDINEDFGFVNSESVFHIDMFLHEGSQYYEKSDTLICFFIAGRRVHLIFDFFNCDFFDWGDSIFIKSKQNAVIVSDTFVDNLIERENIRLLFLELYFNTSLNIRMHIEYFGFDLHNR